MRPWRGPGSGVVDCGDRVRDGAQAVILGHPNENRGTAAAVRWLGGARLTGSGWEPPAWRA